MSHFKKNPEAKTSTIKKIYYGIKNINIGTLIELKHGKEY